MLKKVLSWLLDLYIYPIHLNNRIAIYTKGRILRNREEHVLCTIDYIRSKGTFGKNEVIVDAGVYNGSTVSLFSNHFKESRVIGFEPNPDKFAYASAKFEGKENVKIENMAVGEKDGVAQFHLATTDSASSLNPINDGQRMQELETFEVETASLDSYFKDEAGVLILKLDIEGYELKALQSSVEFLSKTKYVITEMNNNLYHTDGCSYFEVDEYLRSQGFKLIILNAGYNNNGLEQYDAVYENQKLI